MSPVTGAAGDFAEVKDVNANVVEYVSATGEVVPQFGLVLDVPNAVAVNTTLAGSASYVEVGAIAGAIVVTVPAASAVTPGHMLVINDGNGSVSSSATVAVKTPANGGKIGAVAANTNSTSAASYAFMNAAYSSIRLISDGTNWNPF